MTNEAWSRGHVQTVLGPIASDEMGITLTHEHLLIDIRTTYFQEPATISDMRFVDEPITLDNLHWVRHHPLNCRTNLILDDEREAIDEALLYKLEGGSTIVDCSNRNHRRDPKAVARISRATGLHVIMGSGYYVWPSFDATMDDKSEDDIFDEFMTDIHEGMDGTGVKSGLIGEIGISSPMHSNEAKVLAAAARAQAETGLPVNIHSPRDPRDPLKVIQFLEKHGADPTHVIMCDIDRTLLTHESRVELARTGCFLEYDHFGQLDYYLMPDIDMPNDHSKVNEIIALGEDGFLDQVLVSHDICWKIMRRKYGGHGYAHILQYVVPVMKQKGMQREEIDRLLIDNPKRAFAIR